MLIWITIGYLVLVLAGTLGWSAHRTKQMEKMLRRARWSWMFQPTSRNLEEIGAKLLWKAGAGKGRSLDLCVLEVSGELFIALLPTKEHDELIYSHFGLSAVQERVLLATLREQFMLNFRCFEEERKICKWKLPKGLLESLQQQAALRCL